MKISEVLVESQLQEGPLGNIASAIGRGVGKTVGGVAKGIGAVAGGIAGIGKAFKKGYHAGQGTVAGDDEDEPATKPAGGGGGAAPAATGGGAAPAAQQPAAAPAAQPAAGAAPAAQQPAAGAAPAATGGGAAPAAEKPADGGPDPKTPFGKLAGAAAGKPAAEPAANDSAYAQVQKAVNGLAPEQKKEIVAMLQADPKVKAAMKKPAAKKPAAKPAATTQPAATNEPAAQSTDAQPQATTGRTQGGGKVAGQLSNSPSAVKRREKRAAKKGATTYTDTVQQKRLTPGGFSQMVTGLTKQNSSIERTGTIIRENFSFFRKR